jgi:pentatricopeptide repeat protein
LPSSLHQCTLQLTLAAQVFKLMRDQIWCRPHIGIYIKLITMLGKCKQPEKAHELFQSMIEEVDGCAPNLESRPWLPAGCATYSILIKSCLHAYDF